MIVIGVDVHKQSLTAVAVDEVGRAVAELTVGSSAELVAWSGSLDPERLWAVEDCRQLTGALERRLLAVGESLVRVPPKLMAPERRAGRARGKSDPIDALAVARAALREPHLDRPRPGETALRELKRDLFTEVGALEQLRGSGALVNECDRFAGDFEARKAGPDQFPAHVKSVLPFLHEAAEGLPRLGLAGALDLLERSLGSAAQAQRAHRDVLLTLSKLR